MKSLKGNLIIIGLFAILFMLISVGKVDAEATIYYPIWINGEQFTNKRRVIPCGDGYASYSAYGDGSHISVYIENATITEGYEYEPNHKAAIYSESDELETIAFIGNNKISPTDSNVDGIFSANGKKTKIKSNSGDYLEIENVNYGIHMGRKDITGTDLTLENINIKINNPHFDGIWVDHNINIYHCDLNIKNDSESYNGIVSNSGNKIIIDNSIISLDTKSNSIQIENGEELNIVSGNITLKSENDRGINVTSISNNNSENTNGFFTLKEGKIDITSALEATNIPNDNIKLPKNVSFEKGETLHDTGNVILQTEDTRVALPFFYDVPVEKWYYDAVKFVYKNKIILGLEKTRFGPDNSLTRGMIVTMLYRLEGNPKVTGTSIFDDNQNKDVYFYEPVIWATQNKIIFGKEDGRFHGFENIKREDLAVVLYRYAKFKGKDISKTSDLKQFKDTAKISTYARTQVKWAVGTGILNGYSNKTLNPRLFAARSEIAGIITNYCKKVGR